MIEIVKNLWKFYLVLKSRSSDALKSCWSWSWRSSEARALCPHLKFVSGQVCVRGCKCVCVQNVSLWHWMAEVLVLGRRRHFLTMSRRKAKRHQESSPPRSPNYSLTCTSCKLQRREGQLCAPTLWNGSS